jgi:hypothetical protein
MRLTQTTSGKGGFTSTGAGSASFTASQVFVIDPFNMGGRLGSLSNCFLEYRIVKLLVQYNAAGLSLSGVEEIVTGGSTTPSYAARPFSICMLEDPALVFTTYTAMLLSGGRACNTSRPFSLGPFKGGGLSKWRFTSTVAAAAGPPTGIDYRLAAPAQLRMAYFNDSSTAVESFGDFIFTGIVQFRGPCSISAPIGIQITPSQCLQSTEEKKEEEEIPRKISDEMVLVSRSSIPVKVGKSESKQVDEMVSTPLRQQDSIKSKTGPPSKAYTFF